MLKHFTQILMCYEICDCFIVSDAPVVVIKKFKCPEPFQGWRRFEECGLKLVWRSLPFQEFHTNKRSIINVNTDLKLYDFGALNPLWLDWFGY